jgi:hypothetical protein
VVDAECGDLLEFHLDFAEGTTGLAAVLPYRPGGLWREPRFGDLMVQPQPRFIWD